MKAMFRLSGFLKFLGSTVSSLFSAILFITILSFNFIDFSYANRRVRENKTAEQGIRNPEMEKRNIEVKRRQESLKQHQELIEASSLSRLNSLRTESNKLELNTIEKTFEGYGEERETTALYRIFDLLGKPVRSEMPGETGLGNDGKSSPSNASVDAGGVALANIKKDAYRNYLEFVLAGQVSKESDPLPPTQFLMLSRTLKVNPLQILISIVVEAKNILDAGQAGTRSEAFSKALKKRGISEEKFREVCFKSK